MHGPLIDKKDEEKHVLSIKKGKASGKPQKAQY